MTKHIGTYLGKQRAPMIVEYQCLSGWVDQIICWFGHRTDSDTLPFSESDAALRVADDYGVEPILCRSPWPKAGPVDLLWSVDHLVSFWDSLTKEATAWRIRKIAVDWECYSGPIRDWLHTPPFDTEMVNMISAAVHAAYAVGVRFDYAYPAEVSDKNSPIGMYASLADKTITERTYYRWQNPTPVHRVDIDGWYLHAERGPDNKFRTPEDLLVDDGKRKWLYLVEEAVQARRTAKMMCKVALGVR